MKFVLKYTIIFAILILPSCTKTEVEKLNIMLESNELTIQMNTYGGIGGYSEEVFQLKEGEYQNMLIKQEGTDYQSYVVMTLEKRKLLNQFLIEAYATHNPDKGMSASCMTGVDFEFIFKKGFTELRLVPDEKCYELFFKVLKHEE